MGRYILTLMVVSGLLVGPALSDTAHAAEVVYKGSTVAPDPSPWAQLLKRYKKLVRKGSDKRIKVKLYFGTKGDEQSLVRQVRKGTLHFAGVSTGAMSVVVPEIDILEMPYLFDSHAQADKVLDAVRPLIREILEARGFKLLMFSENGYRCFGTNKPVRTPADMAGMKMRSQESKSHKLMYDALGASARTMAVSEVLPSLNTGNVEGFDNTALFTQAASWHQAIKYFTLSDHIYQPAMLIANKDWYDALPPELQSAVLPDNIAKEEKRGRKGIRSLNSMILDNFKQAEVEVIKLTKAQKDAFKKKARPSWDKRLKVATPMGKKLFKAIQEAKGK